MPDEILKATDSPEQIKWSMNKNQLCNCRVVKLIKHTTSLRKKELEKIIGKERSSLYGIIPWMYNFFLHFIRSTRPPAGDRGGGGGGGGVFVCS